MRALLQRSLFTERTSTCHSCTVNREKVVLLFSMYFRMHENASTPDITVYPNAKVLSRKLRI